MWKKVQGPDRMITLHPYGTVISFPENETMNTARNDSGQFGFTILDNKSKYSVKLKDYTTNKRFKLIIEKINNGWFAKIR